MTTIINRQKREGKMIFSRPMARYLLRKGHMILDVKPDKFNIERTIFVFEVKNGLQLDVDNYIQNAESLVNGELMKN